MHIIGTITGLYEFYARTSAKLVYISDDIPPLSKDERYLVLKLYAK